MGKDKPADKTNEPDDNDYLELAKITQADFISRRSLEWKLSLGLWGSIAAFTYTVVKTQHLQKRLSELSICWVICIAVLIIGIHWYVLSLVQWSHARDKKLYWWYRGKLEGSDKERPWEANRSPTRKEVYKGDNRRKLWLTYHIAITILVVAGAAFLLKISP